MTPANMSELINPKALTARQLRLLEKIARAVPTSKRGNFLKQVFGHLAHEPSDAAVSAVINAQLNLIPHHDDTLSKFGELK
jgi:hypothetical protein